MGVFQIQVIFFIFININKIYKEKTKKEFWTWYMRKPNEHTLKDLERDKQPQEGSQAWKRKAFTWSRVAELGNVETAKWCVMGHTDVE